MAELRANRSPPKRSEPLRLTRRRGVPSPPRPRSRRRDSLPGFSDRYHMTSTELLSVGAGAVPLKRYRLPGIEREGIAQLSLLETALWPIQGGMLPKQTFESSYSYPTAADRKTATVTVRAALGLQPIDEYVLWGLLGATLSWQDPDSVL